MKARPKTKPRKARARPTTESKSGREYTVFIADDEPEVLLQFEEQLKLYPAFGFRIVGTSQSADETIEKLRKTAADLLILDIDFSKGKTGLEIIDRLKQLQPRLKILIVTQKGEQYQKRSFLARANGFLVKPYPPIELPEALATVLSGQLYYNEALLQPPAPFEGLPYKSKMEQLSHSISDDDRLTYEDREYLQARLSGMSDAQYAAENKIKKETIYQRRNRIRRHFGLTTDIEDWLFRKIGGTGGK
jgi:two-component system, NarL family, invasion response regulator UvrY